MNRKTVGAAVLAAAAIALTGCAQTDDPDSLVTYCKGVDKVFVLDSMDNGAELFVIPNHVECKGVQS